MEINDELKRLLASDSVYALLRGAFKSPSYYNVDNCDDDCYVELYEIVKKLKYHPNIII